MANLALIRGAAAAAPKFTDIRAAVEPGIRKFENIMSLKQKFLEERKIEAERLQKEKERNEALMANDLYSLNRNLDSIAPGKDLEEGALQLVFDTKKANEELVRLKGTLPPLEYAKRYSEQEATIANVTRDIAAAKEWFVDLREDWNEGNISDAMTADDYQEINDIVEGKTRSTYVDGRLALILNEGTDKEKIIYANELPKQIFKRDVLHKELTALSENAVNKAQKLGSESQIFKDELRKIDTAKMTLEDAKSLAVDFWNLGGENGNLADVFNQIAEDETGNAYLQFAGEDQQLDKDEFLNGIAAIKGSKNFIQYVKEQYKLSATKAVDSVYQAYINSTKPTSSSGFTQGLTQEIQLFAPVMNSASQEAINIANIREVQGPPEFIGATGEMIEVQDVQKADVLVNKLKSINTTNQEKYSTREEMLNLFMTNAAGDEKLKNMDRGELEAIFNTINGDALIFYNSAPLEVNLNNPTSIYRTILQNTPGLSAEAQQYFLNQHILQQAQNFK